MNICLAGGAIEMRLRDDVDSRTQRSHGENRSGSIDWLANRDSVGRSRIEEDVSSEECEVDVRLQDRRLRATCNSFEGTFSTFVSVNEYLRYKYLICDAMRFSRCYNNGDEDKVGLGSSGDCLAKVVRLAEDLSKGVISEEYDGRFVMNNQIFVREIVNDSKCGPLFASCLAKNAALESKVSSSKNKIRRESATRSEASGFNDKLNSRLKGATRLECKSSSYLCRNFTRRKTILPEGSSGKVLSDAGNNCLLIEKTESRDVDRRKLPIKKRLRVSWNTIDRLFHFQSKICPRSSKDFPPTHEEGDAIQNHRLSRNLKSITIYDPSLKKGVERPSGLVFREKLRRKGSRPSTVDSMKELEDRWRKTVLLSRLLPTVSPRSTTDETSLDEIRSFDFRKILQLRSLQVEDDEGSSGRQRKGSTRTKTEEEATRTKLEEENTRIKTKEDAARIKREEHDVGRKMEEDATATNDLLESDTNHNLNREAEVYLETLRLLNVTASPEIETQLLTFDAEYQRELDFVTTPYSVDQDGTTDAFSAVYPSDYFTDYEDYSDVYEEYEGDDGGSNGMDVSWFEYEEHTVESFSSTTDFLVAISTEKDKTFKTTADVQLSSTFSFADYAEVSALTSSVVRTSESTESAERESTMLGKVTLENFTEIFTSTLASFDVYADVTTVARSTGESLDGFSSFSMEMSHSTGVAVEKYPVTRFDEDAVSEVEPQGNMTRVLQETVKATTAESIGTAERTTIFLATSISEMLAVSEFPRTPEVGAFGSSWVTEVATTFTSTQALKDATAESVESTTAFVSTQINESPSTILETASASEKQSIGTETTTQETLTSSEGSRTKVLAESTEVLDTFEGLGVSSSIDETSDVETTAEEEAEIVTVSSFRVTSEIAPTSEGVDVGGTLEVEIHATSAPSLAPASDIASDFGEKYGESTMPEGSSTSHVLSKTLGITTATDELAFARSTTEQITTATFQEVTEVGEEYATFTEETISVTTPVLHDLQATTAGKDAGVSQTKLPNAEVIITKMTEDEVVTVSARISEVITSEEDFRETTESGEEISIASVSPRTSKPEITVEEVDLVKSSREEEDTTIATSAKVTAIASTEKRAETAETEEDTNESIVTSYISSSPMKIKSTVTETDIIESILQEVETTAFSVPANTTEFATIEPHSSTGLDFAETAVEIATATDEIIVAKSTVADEDFIQTLATPRLEYSEGIVVTESHTVEETEATAAPIFTGVSEIQFTAGEEMSASSESIEAFASVGTIAQNVDIGVTPGATMTVRDSFNTRDLPSLFTDEFRAVVTALRTSGEYTESITEPASYTNEADAPLSATDIFRPSTPSTPEFSAYFTQELYTTAPGPLIPESHEILSSTTIEVLGTTVAPFEAHEFFLTTAVSMTTEYATILKAQSTMNLAGASSTVTTRARASSELITTEVLPFSTEASVTPTPLYVVNMTEAPLFITTVTLPELITTEIGQFSAGEYPVAFTATLITVEYSEATSGVLSYSTEVTTASMLTGVETSRFYSAEFEYDSTTAGVVAEFPEIMKHTMSSVSTAIETPRFAIATVPISTTTTTPYLRKYEGEVVTGEILTIDGHTEVSVEVRTSWTPFGVDLTTPIAAESSEEVTASIAESSTTRSSVFPLETEVYTSLTESSSTLITQHDTSTTGETVSTTEMPVAESSIVTFEESTTKLLSTESTSSIAAESSEDVTASMAESSTIRSSVFRLETEGYISLTESSSILTTQYAASTPGETTTMTEVPVAESSIVTLEESTTKLLSVKSTSSTFYPETETNALGTESYSAAVPLATYTELKMETSKEAEETTTSEELAQTTELRAESSAVPESVEETYEDVTDRYYDDEYAEDYEEEYEDEETQKSSPVWYDYGEEETSTPKSPAETTTIHHAKHKTETTAKITTSYGESTFTSVTARNILTELRKTTLELTKLPTEIESTTRVSTISFISTFTEELSEIPEREHTTETISEVETITRQSERTTSTETLAAEKTTVPGLIGKTITLSSNEGTGTPFESTLSFSEVGFSETSEMYSTTVPYDTGYVSSEDALSHFTEAEGIDVATTASASESYSTVVSETLAEKTPEVRPMTFTVSTVGASTEAESSVVATESSVSLTEESATSSLTLQTEIALFTFETKETSMEEFTRTAETTLFEALTKTLGTENTTGSRLEIESYDSEAEPSSVSTKGTIILEETTFTRMLSSTESAAGFYTESEIGPSEAETSSILTTRSPATSEVSEVEATEETQGATIVETATFASTSSMIESTTESTTESTSEITTESTTENTTETTRESTTESSTDFITEITTETTSESTTETTSESTTETTSESTTETTTETTTEITSKTTTETSTAFHTESKAYTSETEPSTISTTKYFTTTEEAEEETSEETKQAFTLAETTFTSTSSITESEVYTSETEPTSISSTKHFTSIEDVEVETTEETEHASTFEETTFTSTSSMTESEVHTSETEPTSISTMKHFTSTEDVEVETTEETEHASTLEETTFTSTSSMTDSEVHTSETEPTSISTTKRFTSTEEVEAETTEETEHASTLEETTFTSTSSTTETEAYTSETIRFSTSTMKHVTTTEEAEVETSEEAEETTTLEETALTTNLPTTETAATSHFESTYTAETKESVETTLRISTEMENTEESAPTTMSIEGISFSASVTETSFTATSRLAPEKTEIEDYVESSPISHGTSVTYGEKETESEIELTPSVAEKFTQKPIITLYTAPKTTTLSTVDEIAFGTSTTLSRHSTFTPLSSTQRTKIGETIESSETLESTQSFNATSLVTVKVDAQDYIDFTTFYSTSVTPPEQEFVSEIVSSTASSSEEFTSISTPHTESGTPLSSTLEDVDFETTLTTSVSPAVVTAIASQTLSTITKSTEVTTTATSLETTLTTSVSPAVVTATASQTLSTITKSTEVTTTATSLETTLATSVSPAVVTPLTNQTLSPVTKPTEVATTDTSFETEVEDYETSTAMSEATSDILKTDEYVSGVESEENVTEGTSSTIESMLSHGATRVGLSSSTEVLDYETKRIVSETYTPTSTVSSMEEIFTSQFYGTTILPSSFFETGSATAVSLITDVATATPVSYTDETTYRFSAPVSGTLATEVTTMAEETFTTQFHEITTFPLMLSETESVLVPQLITVIATTIPVSYIGETTPPTYPSFITSLITPTSETKTTTEKIFSSHFYEGTTFPSILYKSESVTTPFPITSTVTSTPVFYTERVTVGFDEVITLIEIGEEQKVPATLAYTPFEGTTQIFADFTLEGLSESTSASVEDYGDVDKFYDYDYGKDYKEAYEDEESTAPISPMWYDYEDRDFTTTRETLETSSVVPENPETSSAMKTAETSVSASEASFAASIDEISPLHTFSTQTFSPMSITSEESAETAASPYEVENVASWTLEETTLEVTEATELLFTVTYEPLTLPEVAASHEGSVTSSTKIYAALESTTGGALSASFQGEFSSVSTTAPEAARFTTESIDFPTLFKHVLNFTSEAPAGRIETIFTTAYVEKFKSIGAANASFMTFASQDALSAFPEETTVEYDMTELSHETPEVSSLRESFLASTVAFSLDVESSAEGTFSSSEPEIDFSVTGEEYPEMSYEERKERLLERLQKLEELQEEIASREEELLSKENEWQREKERRKNERKKVPVTDATETDLSPAITNESFLADSVGTTSSFEEMTSELSPSTFATIETTTSSITESTIQILHLTSDMPFISSTFEDEYETSTTTSVSVTPSTIATTSSEQEEEMRTLNEELRQRQENLKNKRKELQERQKQLDDEKQDFDERIEEEEEEEEEAEEEADEEAEEDQEATPTIESIDESKERFTTTEETQMSDDRTEYGADKLEPENITASSERTTPSVTLAPPTEMTTLDIREPTTIDVPRNHSEKSADGLSLSDSAEEDRSWKSTGEISESEGEAEDATRSMCLKILKDKTHGGDFATERICLPFAVENREAGDDSAGVRFATDEVKMGKGEDLEEGRSNVEGVQLRDHEWRGRESTEQLERRLIGISRVDDGATLSAVKAQRKEAESRGGNLAGARKVNRLGEREWLESTGRTSAPLGRENEIERLVEENALRARRRISWQGNNRVVLQSDEKNFLGPQRNYGKSIQNDKKKTNERSIVNDRKKTDRKSIKSGEKKNDERSIKTEKNENYKRSILEYEEDKDNIADKKQGGSTEVRSNRGREIGCSVRRKRSSFTWPTESTAWVDRYYDASEMSTKFLRGTTTEIEGPLEEDSYAMNVLSLEYNENEKSHKLKRRLINGKPESRVTLNGDEDEDHDSAPPTGNGIYGSEELSSNSPDGDTREINSRNEVLDEEDDFSQETGDYKNEEDDRSKENGNDYPDNKPTSMEAEVKTRVTPAEWPTERMNVYHVGGTRSWDLEFPGDELSSGSENAYDEDDDTEYEDNGEEVVEGTTCYYVVLEHAKSIPEKSAVDEAAL